MPTPGCRSSAFAPSAARSQPANALLVGQDLYLVDAGDGTVGQLAKAGLNLLPLRAVLPSDQAAARP